MGTTAFLRAFSQAVPESWELHAQAEANARSGELDLVLEDRIAELDYEAEEFSLAEEMTQEVTFKDNPGSHQSARARHGRFQASRDRATPTLTCLGSGKSLYSYCEAHPWCPRLPATGGRSWATLDPSCNGQPYDEGRVQRANRPCATIAPRVSHVIVYLP